MNLDDIFLVTQLLYYVIGIITLMSVCYFIWELTEDVRYRRRRFRRLLRDAGKRWR